MALTEEEKTYFFSAIDVIFKKVQSKNSAQKWVQDHYSPKEVLEHLKNDCLAGQDFIAYASSYGIKAPDSIMSFGDSDITNIFKFVGYNSSAKLPDNQESLLSLNLKMMDDTKNLDNKNTAEHIEINKKISALSSSLTNLYDIVTNKETVSTEESNISDKADGFIIKAGFKTLFSCTYISKVYRLHKKIAEVDDTSILSILKAYSDCSTWSGSREDFYFTNTSNPENCTPLIPDALVFSECINALGISIKETESD